MSFLKGMHLVAGASKDMLALKKAIYACSPCKFHS
uniref:Uncharacterized protein n=1 Tax=Nelumbo nucifera TaxID=4432 RepID=A0A822XYQ0_NELNU|nr:TPA_asm: hypothetical protein HUJ06_025358 [Nelumbo nucifera]DAD24427.1 TPA_asm: hypothetical protein HUJ06_025891 [Nelumbo nucifera]